MKLDLVNPAWQQTLPPGRTVAGDAPVAACAFNKDGSLVAFALGDGRVRLLPADIHAAETPAADPLHSDEVAGKRAAVAKGVEGGNAGAE